MDVKNFKNASFIVRRGIHLNLRPCSRLGTCAQNFSNLIKVGKEIENGIQGGRIVNNSVAQVVQQNSLPKKKVKSFSFTTLAEPYADIFERLRLNGLLQSRKGFIHEYTPKNFDLFKSCAYHSIIQGHDTEDCPALKFKIQSMIDSGKIKLQLESSSSSGCIADTSTIFVKGDPSKLAPRHLKRKHATSQEH
ncbi:hypothetical protein KY290_000802 [Solanum tuberosum]|uniref:Uncharacterized protein n=1 Tax=Solanum tuberosum TaxID=4113 RepID=A0ABQ7WKC8_SOLTU|nr:hypothetical protein KY289_000874 [Solanum tuberosum]KAH0781204.1 hypothetical protein KY290_000802 [Solanum tuberosum]